MSLLNNACEAMPEGGTIAVSTIEEDSHMRIDFKDSGQGMDKDTMSRIFEPFFTTKETGTGLGLSICYGIMQACQGDLRFDSAPGQGTTATLILPFKPNIENA